MNPINLSARTTAIIAIVLFGAQLLIPVFATGLTSAQMGAIGAFITGISSILGIRGYWLNTDGSTANPAPKPQDYPKAP